MEFLINDDELSAICGLPHMQQLAYLRGVRPYMDVKSGVVGIKRRVSYQSIAEQLYVEPHQGIRSQSFSRDQVRRAVSGLVRAGLISIESEGMHLILRCKLATRGFSVQNKAAINPPQKAATNPHNENLVTTQVSEDETVKPAIAKSSKAAIPLYKDNLYIFLLSQFEKFWSLYPEKKSRNAALAVFEQLTPNAELFNRMMHALIAQINHREAMALQNKWMPPWKYPANWLAQRCWEDELSIDALQERPHAEHAKNSRNRGAAPDLFCPPEDDDEPAGNNVIQFQRFQ